MTIRKIVSIQNVGKFAKLSATGNTEFVKYNLIYGENGKGKTTLCAILRSLQTGDHAHITGRKTLGSSGLPAVHLLLNGTTTNFKFTSDTWSDPYENIHIFDQHFISENVYTGDVIGTNQKRNLYKVIVGQDAVKMAKQLETLVSDIRGTNSKIKDFTSAIERQLPYPVKLKGILELKPDPDLSMKIIEVEKQLKAYQELERIKQGKLFQFLTVPAPIDDLQELLNTTLDNLPASASSIMKTHQAKHNITSKDQEWLAKGLNFKVEEGCPFCGTDGVSENNLIQAYRAIFSTAYTDLKTKITNVGLDASKTYGDEITGKIETQIAENQAAFEFWKPYLELSNHDTSDVQVMKSGIKNYSDVVMPLLRGKVSSPLEILKPGDGYLPAKDRLKAVENIADGYNQYCIDMNKLISDYKEKLSVGSAQELKDKLDVLQCYKKRFEAGLREQCEALIDFKAQKDSQEKSRDAIKDKLATTSKTLVAKYETEINRYLKLFNAGFTIDSVDHDYVGGVKASFSIKINKVSVPLGDEKTPLHEPSFRNTLSSGDRSTLALAFFLAQLGEDKTLSEKVLVFDDPFSSQDSFRRNQTALEVVKAGKKAAQIIVLSHDAHFLKLVKDKVTDEFVRVMKLSPMGDSSIISEIDLNKFVEPELVAYTGMLQEFHSNDVGEPINIVQKIRPLLEGYTKNCCLTFFEPTDNLGGILQKIAATGDSHPLWHLYDELNDLNDYTKQHHHENGIVTALVDSTELKGAVERTLIIVTGNAA